MKTVCLVLIGLNLVVLAASFLSNESWAYQVCRNALGMCDYQMALGIGGLGFVGLFFAMKEMS